VRGTIAVDFGGVMERMRRLRVDISPHDSASRFRELGVDVFIGQGSFDMTDKTRGRGRPRPIPERARPTRPTGPTAAETFTACHSADES
jgi:hypothetical protein